MSSPIANAVFWRFILAYDIVKLGHRHSPADDVVDRVVDNHDNAFPQ